MSKKVSRTLQIDESTAPNTFTNREKCSVTDRQNTLLEMTYRSTARITETPSSSKGTKQPESVRSKQVKIKEKQSLDTSQKTKADCGFLSKTNRDNASNMLQHYDFKKHKA